MKVLRNALCVLGTAALLCTSCNDDNDNNTDFELGDLEGTVLVTFGSSYEAPQETFALIDEAFNAEYSDDEIRWGYTSDLILNLLRQGNGENGLELDNDSPEEAISIMLEEGYSTFNVQSLHVIPGEEYDELIESTEAIEEEYEGVEFNIGMPLLSSDEDVDAVAAIMAAEFATEVEAGQPVLFMGHGTPHEADAKYALLETALKAINENFYVGTVEGIGFEAGTTSIGSIVTKLQALETQPTEVTITPFMSIAGDHANNDMNGNTGETDVDEQSWRERLEGAGYTVDCVMKGLGDYADVRAIWVAHFATAKEE